MFIFYNGIICIPISIVLEVSNLSPLICTLADCHPWLWDSGDDPAEKRSWPTWLPRQLRGSCGRCGAIRFCLADWATSRLPIGGDLQGGCCIAVSWANDWPAPHVSCRQCGHRSSVWGWDSEEVSSLVGQPNKSDHGLIENVQTKKTSNITFTFWNTVIFAQMWLVKQAIFTNQIK